MDGGHDTFLAVDLFVPVLVSEFLMISSSFPVPPGASKRKIQPQLISESVAFSIKGTTMYVSMDGYVNLELTE